MPCSVIQTPPVAITPAASLDAKPRGLGAGIQGRTSRLATGHLLLANSIEMRTLYLGTLYLRTLYLGTPYLGTIVADLGLESRRCEQR